MEKTNLENMFKDMEAKGGESQWYKLKEGTNRMRIMTDFFKVENINRGKTYGGIISEFNKPIKDDKVTTKAWSWAIVRGEVDEFKIVQFGKTILGQLVELKNSSEYSFDGFPMSFDIDIKAKGAGTMEVEYTIIPARQNTDVTQAEMEALNKLKTIPEIVAKIIEKQDGKVSSAKGIEYPKEEINPADIPF